MRIEPKLGGCSVVLVGNFNPAIFSPAWFAMHDVVSATEAERAEQVFIVPEFARFKLGGKLITVESNKFSVETSEAPWIACCDLATKTFGEFLFHTPINQVGINRQVHFDVRSEDTRNAIGRALAPTDPWGEWGKKIEESPPSLRGGFVTLIMQEGWKDEQFVGFYQARVEPSAMISSNTGIFVQINHHCQKSSTDDPGASSIVGFLADRFEDSIRHSEWIIDQLMELAENLRQ